MSLWNKTKDLISAPVWYARRRLFDGKAQVSEGKMVCRGGALSVGDAVMYVAPAADKTVSGLTSGNIYYVVSVDGDKYGVSATKGGAAITVGAATDSGTHMLIKADTSTTTSDGTLDYALLPVSRADIVANRYGKAFNTPGWWRYRKFTKNSVATVHAELLVSLKGDFYAEDVQPTGNVNDPTKDQVVNTLNVNLENFSMTGKSVTVNDLEVKNASAETKVNATTLNAANGDVVVGSGDIETAILTTNAN